MQEGICVWRVVQRENSTVEKCLYDPSTQPAQFALGSLSIQLLLTELS